MEAEHTRRNKQLKNLLSCAITAGVHTVEVSAKSGLTYRNNEQWDFKRDCYWHHKRLTAVLNPHKLAKVDGKYECLYGSAARTNNALATIADMMELSEYSFTRIDLCFNFDCPYSDTDKIIRLLLLLVQNYLAAENYYSEDAFTGAKKTMRVYQRRGNNSELQIEHYNRAMIDQTMYSVRVTNRLEVRSIGAAVTGKNPRSMWADWLCILRKSLTANNLSEVESRLINGNMAQWERICNEGGLCKVQQFVRASADSIYTQRQLDELLKISNAGQCARNNLSKTASGFNADRYTLQDLVQVVNALNVAAEQYFAN